MLPQSGASVWRLCEYSVCVAAWRLPGGSLPGNNVPAPPDPRFPLRGVSRQLQRSSLGEDNSVNYGQKDTKKWINETEMMSK